MNALRRLLQREVRLPRPNREHLLALLALTGLAVLLFHEAVFAGRSLFVRDINMWWLPQVEAFVRCIAAGSWPVWDPWRAFGQPMLADPSREVLYPFAWLNLVLAPRTSYTIFAVSHLVLSALGLYRLARRWEVSFPGALVGAAVWMTSGPLLSLVSLPHHLAGAAWMPWVFLAAESALAGPPGRVLVWGAVMAGQILAGSADLVAMTWLAFAVYAAFHHLRWRPLRSPANVRLLSRAAIASAFALGLTAAQWWPTLAAASVSERFALADASRTTWSLHPLSLLELLLPFHWVDLPLLPAHLDTILGFKDPWLRSIHLGVPAGALVLAALVPHALARRRTLLVLLVGALLVALGRHLPIYGFLVTVLPPLRILRFPVKAMTVAALAWSLLAALGWDAWRAGGTERSRWTRRLVLPLAVATGLAAAAALLAAFGAERWGPALLLEHPDASYTEVAAATARRLAWGASASAICLALALAGRGGRPRPAIVAGASGALALASLAATHWKLNPTGHPQIFSHRPEAIARLQGEDPRLYVYDYSVATPAQAARGLRTTSQYRVARVPEGWSLGEARVLGVHLYLNPPTAARWGLRGSYDLDLLGLYDRPLAQLTEQLREIEGTRLHLRLLQIGGVTHVLTLHEGESWRDLILRDTIPGLLAEPIRIYQVPDPLPRAFAVGEARRADVSTDLARLFDGDFDPRRMVLLHDAGPATAAPGFEGTARIVSSRPDRLKVEAELSGHGYVVLTEGYDPGWRATVDGVATPVLRANVAFRAVEVPAGRHVVEMVYRPRAVVLGVGLSAASALLGLGLALRALRSTPH
jgi:hypothetical protein